MNFALSFFAIGTQFMRSYPPGMRTGKSTTAPMAKRKAPTTGKTGGPQRQHRSGERQPSVS